MNSAKTFTELLLNCNERQEAVRTETRRIAEIIRSLVIGGREFLCSAVNASDCPLAADNA
jgi:hypothetical protein